MIGRVVSAAPPVPLRMPGTRPYAAAAACGVLLVTALRLVWLALQPADLYPDEAQYWFWAQHPALGYYSKPPLVAWLIAATTGLFGDGEFAIRLSAPLLHAATAGLIYAIGARLYDRRVGFWSAIAYASLPGVSASSFLISTDAPLMPFWAAALYAFIRAREDNRGRSGAAAWWAAVGVAVGLGLYAKYAMAYWLLSALGLVLVCREERRHLRRLLGAGALAFVVYLPNVAWNWRHQFVSYLHLRDNADLGGSLFHPGAFLEFFASQFGVFGPIFFAVLIALAVRPGRLVEPSARLLAVFALPTLGMMLAIGFLSRAHPNWAAPTYVSATVLVVAWMLRRGWRGLLAVSIALNLVAAAAVFGGRDALAAAGVVVPARYDPLHRLRGWRELGREVGAALAADPGLGLLADDRELVAALIYYVRPHPFDAVKWNPRRLVKDEWDLTNDLSLHPGASFLVVTEHNDADDMRRSFAEVTPLATLSIPFGPGGSRRYELYIARDFIGYPQDRH